MRDIVMESRFTYMINAFDQWTQSAYFDASTRAELLGLSDAEKLDRFRRELEFGTGGLRSMMGAGTNRMNRYMVRKVTKGLADWLLADGTACAREKGVAIAYDTRNNSREFALEAAQTLCAQGIPALLFDDVVPTPTLSYAVRHLGCAAGIVITASHNPKQYNGYKVYNKSGGQLVPDEARQVSENVNRVELTTVQVMDIDQAVQSGLLRMLGWDVVDGFLKAVQRQAHALPQPSKQNLCIVYTPLHGAGNRAVSEILKQQGYTNLHLVASQAVPDGDFPTVQSPNPEERDALSLGIQQAQDQQADIVIGTDPDCDRVGVAVVGEDGYVLLTGNQIGALLLDYLLKQRAGNQKTHTVIKTIVTGELGADIARAHGLTVLDTLTGFKYIGEKINELEQTGGTFFMGYEESFGYLIGDHARDKDGVVSSMLICEMAAHHKAQGRTLLQSLDALHQQYGFYLDALDTFIREGAEGEAQIQKAMDTLRAQGARFAPGITKVSDYAQGVDGLPKSDVLKIWFDDGSWMAARPSGTEPKVKAYYSIRQRNPQLAEQRLFEIREYAKKVGLS